MDSTKKDELPSWATELEDAYIKDNFVHGFIKEEETLKRVLELHGRSSLVNFIHSHQDNFLKRHSKRHEDSRLLWHYGSIPFTGTPFILINSYEHQCEYGKPKTQVEKSKFHDDHDYSKKSRKRFHMQHGRKIGCKATIIVKELQMFPSHCVALNATRLEKQRVLSKLKDKSIEEEITKSKVYFLSLPMEIVHCHTLMGTRRLSYQLKDKIEELVTDNITNVKVIKKFLKRYVDELCKMDIIQPHMLDRSYYPSERDIINCIHRMMSAGQYSQLDQVHLESIIQQWIINDNEKADSERTRVLLRKSTVSASSILSSHQVSELSIDIENSSLSIESAFQGDNDATDCESDNENAICDDDDIPTQNEPACSFLFVHQEPWQQRLLVQYGNDLVLLDATYKTTKYSLPLFFLCVRTNCGYIPVAEFIVEHETSVLISEALLVISSWNHDWNPSYFMIDYSEPELNAISRIFPSASVYLCEFHREQAWTRWTRNGKNGLAKEEQEQLLHLLREVAFSSDQTQYEKSLLNVKNSTVYKNHEKVRRYLQNKWFGCIERWCDAFRAPGFHASIRTNNGVESLNNLFKTHYCSLRTGKKVSDLCKHIKEVFIPDFFTKYAKENIQLCSSYKMYDASIPSFLHNRPHWFIKHCMDRLEKVQMYSKNIMPQDDRTFLVKSQSIADVWYKVDLGSNEQFINCQCFDFSKYYLPCKHIFSVLCYIPGYSWASLPEYFRNCPVINIDHNVVQLQLLGSVSLENHMPGVSEEMDMSLVCNELPSELEQSEISTQADAEHVENIEQTALTLRDCLQSLQEFSYLCKDSTSLKSVTAMVSEIATEAKKLLPKASGLTLDSSSISTSRRKEHKRIEQGILPLPTSKKAKCNSLFDKYKKRSGSTADMMRAASITSISECN